ncbi:MAG: DUF2326 domain-containing protein [Xenococcus sp. MO_188.B8]|nr:DUF2326 domain-containing protein [Xenococcus sp. MO_188.B8]
MLRVRRLYSEPATFDAIDFVDGINLIFGETTQGNDKTNGVGKSLSIEFLNYGLLKQHGDSRISRIPSTFFPKDVLICLDFEINHHSLTTKRSVKNNSSPELIIDGVSTKFTNLKDANKKLADLLFENNHSTSSPSFRSILGPLIRDERSEFKSIIKCFDTDKRIPSDYTPHLYLLNIDPFPYQEALRLHKELKSIKAASKKIREDVFTITGKDFLDAKAELNELTRQVKEIENEMQLLENIKGYEIVKDEIIEIENQLEKARSIQAVLKSEISKINLFSGEAVYIDEQEIAELYNQFKEGLGDAISKELQEVIDFKKKIDNFQNTMMRNRYQSVNKKLKRINKEISLLNKKYKNKISILDQDGLLKSLKQTIVSYQRKSEERAELAALINKYSEYEREIKEKKREREKNIYLLDSYLTSSREIIDSLENTILNIHEFVAGNSSCSFDVKVMNNAEVVNVKLRIYDDGSHSNEREKVFLYDIALLLNSDIANRHPGLLVHDNIFDVDKDTLIKSLNYLHNNIETISQKQYILTINSDEFTSDDMDNLELNLEEFKRASFTKDDRFLKGNYQENK